MSSHPHPLGIMMADSDAVAAWKSRVAPEGQGACRFLQVSMPRALGVGMRAVRAEIVETMGKQGFVMSDKVRTKQVVEPCIFNGMQRRTG